MVKIFISNLAKYNEGILKGRWVELGIDKEDLQKEIDEILGEDEEIFVTDSELSITNLEIGEYVDIFRLNELVRQIEEENIDLDVLNAIMSEYSDLEESINIYNNGDYSILYDVSDEEELGYAAIDNDFFSILIPPELENYIDKEAIGRDMCYEGWRIVEEEKIAICFY